MSALPPPADLIGSWIASVCWNWRLQRDLFQETLHCCPRPAVRLLVVQRACQERPVRRGICEGMVGVAVSGNLPIANPGCAHLIFKGGNVVGRRERIVRAGQDEHTSLDLAL